MAYLSIFSNIFCITITILASSIFLCVSGSALPDVISNNNVGGFDSPAKALNGTDCISKYPPGSDTCDYDNCNFTDPNHRFKLACHNDCVNSHGSSYGVCTKTGICYCGQPTKLPVQKPRQCVDQKHAELFDLICKEDCQCTHNLIGGACDWERHACRCEQVWNPKPELDCPYKDSRAYFTDLIEKFNSIGIDLLTIFRLHGKKE